MSTKKDLRRARKQWQGATLKKAVERFPYLKSAPSRYYTPLDLGRFDFLEDVGFPGEYPYTAGPFPFEPLAGLSKLAGKARGGSRAPRAAGYSGYGTPEDTRDYYKRLLDRGSKEGPNLALDLPTQCGYDSDSDYSIGEVGKVGVAVDTLRDLEVIFQPYQGDLNLDKIAFNCTVNAPAVYFIAMFAALAEKHAVAPSKLRSTPQNDILKEYVARGTYIFPPRPAMRLFRETLVYLNKNMPNVNITSGGSYHIREAGATRKQGLAYAMAIMTAYLQEGIDAGIEVDEFAPRFTFNSFGGSMEFLKEIAFHRASRRMYAKILRDRFGAKDPRSMVIRQRTTAQIGAVSTTLQRPLNNLTRSVIGAMAAALSGGVPFAFPPYDEPMGLGWSMEARQLSEDAARIITCEAKIMDVVDPFAGSYCMEALTKEVEDEAWEEYEKIQAMGGAVAAIEQGYMQREVAKSAYEFERKLQTGEELKVGVNCFTGEHELEVETTRLVAHPYDPERREKAEETQIAHLAEVKRSRSEKDVRRLLKELDQKTREQDGVLMPTLIECAKAYVTLQEVCDVFREVFGEYEAPSIL